MNTNTKYTTNVILMADSYKYSHAMGQYPKNTTEMFDYAEARSNKVYDKTVFFGLQYILKAYFSKPITEADVIEAEIMAEGHGVPFNKEGWMIIVNKHNGRLPVIIRAVKEGSVIPNKNALFTIQSTDKEVFWIASWIETILMKVWYPCNVATRTFFVKQMLTEYANKTQDNSFVDLSYHNFGDRGSTSVEAAAIGGMAHLTQMWGSDNFNSIKVAFSFYGENTVLTKEEINKISISIPATEHSSTTAWGRSKEFDMIMNHIENNKGSFIIAAVMDSYDYFNAVNVVTTGIFAEKINSDEYPIFVMRPDSGDPKEILPETIRIMEKNKVPFTTNNKGFKVWNKYRIIWGDGINMESMKVMLDIMVSLGYSTENIAFGSGGWLMQQHDRDTMGFAIKCSQIKVIENNVEIERDVFKDPITAPNKKSKKGKISLFKDKNGEYITKRIEEATDSDIDQMQTIFKNGEFYNNATLQEIREVSKEFIG